MVLINNIGIQLWSIRDEMKGNLLDTLHNVASMGYGGVQFAGFGDNSAKEVKSAMDELDLIPMGAHVQIDELKNNFEETIQYHKTLGNKLIIVPYIEESMRGTYDKYLETALLLNDLGKQLTAEGFLFGYHNHDFEFDVFNDKTGFDILFENTNKDYVKMELDCFWASYTHNDPLEIIEKYGDRCISLHIKDLTMANGEPESIELGEGTLPLKTYMHKGKEFNVKYFIVEQEHFTKEPLESAKDNICYMINAMKNLNKN